MTAHMPIDLICFDVDGTLVRHPTGMVIWEVLNIRFGGSVEQTEYRQQSRLAAARRASDGDVVPLLDVEVNPSQGVGFHFVGVEDLAHTFEVNQSALVVTHIPTPLD